MLQSFQRELLCGSGTHCVLDAVLSMMRMMTTGVTSAIILFVSNVDVVATVVGVTV